MKYYILTARDNESDKLEYMFGDYDREVVQDERADSAHTHYGMNIHMLPNAMQATVDAKLVALGIKSDG